MLLARIPRGITSSFPPPGLCKASFTMASADSWDRIPIDARGMADKYKQLRPMTLAYCATVIERVPFGKKYEANFFQTRIDFKGLKQAHAASQLGVLGYSNTSHQNRSSSSRHF